MTTLHIEHPISDYRTWSAAFARFAGQRRSAGVVGQRVSRPADDPCYVVVDLDFGSAAEAERFEHFLRESVWTNPSASPALAGVPVTRLLEVQAGLSSP